MAEFVLRNLSLMKKKTTQNPYGTLAVTASSLPVLSFPRRSSRVSLKASRRSAISPVSEPAPFEEDVAATNRLYLARLGAPVKDREEAV